MPKQASKPMFDRIVTILTKEEMKDVLYQSNVDFTEEMPGARLREIITKNDAKCEPAIIKVVVKMLGGGDKASS